MLEQVETILPEKVAQKVTEKLLNEFSIQGTVPLTASGEERIRIVQTACDAMQEKILSVPTLRKSEFLIVAKLMLLFIGVTHATRRMQASQRAIQFPKASRFQS